MSVVIKANGVISAQHTFNTHMFPGVEEVIGNRLVCIEPDYKNLINPLLLRRMPRILKMGLAAAQLCITHSGGVSPDGIIVGTGLGCLDNLEKFLKEVLETEEHVTSVLPFINSTHNAVAAQISMLLKNNNYNVTYCHRGFSFESALLDGMMLIEEKQAKNVLVGGIDECTDDFMLLHSYLNQWKKHPVSNLSLLTDETPGTIAGEGSSFFMLSDEAQNCNQAVTIQAVHTFFTPDKPDAEMVKEEISGFLQNNGSSVDQLHAVMLGINGDKNHDALFQALRKDYFSNQTTLYFKHLCGEYYTASAFALWLAAMILEQQTVPAVVKINDGIHPEIKNILIYNQIRNSEHSLIYVNYGCI